MGGGTEKTVEDTEVENFLNLIKITNPQTREAQWSGRTRNLNKTSARHIRIYLLTTSAKEKTLESWCRIKKHYIQREKIKDDLLTENFLLKTMQDRRPFVLVTFFKSWKEKHCQLWNLYPPKIHFRHESEIRAFSNTSKRKDFASLRPKNAEEVLQAEEKWYQTEIKICRKENTAS